MAIMVSTYAFTQPIHKDPTYRWLLWCPYIPSHSLFTQAKYIDPLLWSHKPCQGSKNSYQKASSVCYDFHMSFDMLFAKGKSYKPSLELLTKKKPVMMPTWAFLHNIHRPCLKPKTIFPNKVYICNSLPSICLGLYTAITNLFIPF